MYTFTYLSSKKMASSIGRRSRPRGAYSSASISQPRDLARRRTVSASARPSG